MLYERIFIILLLLGMTAALPSRESLNALRKLLRQEQQDEQQLKANQFNEDVNLWAQSFEQFCLDFVTFVDQCRPIGTHCSQRYVQRHLRSLRRNYSDLYAQLEALEIRYVGQVNEEKLLMPTMRAVRGVLQQYNSMLRQVYAEAYKLVEQ